MVSTSAAQPSHNVARGQVAIDLPAPFKAPRRGDWYARIEAGIRPHVYLLRNAGFDTYSSCEERMEVALTLDLRELERLDALLAKSGFDHCQIIVELERCSGFRQTAFAVVRVGERTQRRRGADLDGTKTSFVWKNAYLYAATCAASRSAIDQGFRATPAAIW